MRGSGKRERGNKPRPITGADPIAVFADPDVSASGEFAPLLDARAEGRQIASRFEHAIYAEGRDATRSAFLAIAPKVRIVHFAGHGTANGGMGSLILGGAMPLDAGLISKLNLSAVDLAVLDGCSTGLSAGGGWVSADMLVRGFLDAGVSEVLAAGWDTASRADRDLMEQFYTEILRGRRPEAALRAAMLHAGAGADSEHPAAWAAFQIYREP